MKDFKQLTQDISEYTMALHKVCPDTLVGFSQMATAATKPGVLDEKTKELIAMALGVAARCDGCLAFHARQLVALGVSREELAETLSVAVYMGGGPSLMYAADALRAYDQFKAG